MQKLMPDSTKGRSGVVQPVADKDIGLMEKLSKWFFNYLRTQCD